jgi:hypothetical protein
MYRQRRRFWFNRERHGDHRAAAVCWAASFDLPAVGLDDTAANRQAQTGAGPMSIAALHPVKLVEYTLALVWGDAYALVGDR